ncbi:MAG: TetR/AcrR family transcriptional regulator [Anaerolineales bacterium]|nr:TetR/AcrR family transcriptional regulator [Anaerolineales bacterium]
MSPRTLLPEERITQILDAALRVFAREGFAKARMETIAEEAGLSKGTLYLYFDSKDALITALLERFFATELQDFQLLLATDAPAADRLLFLAQHLAAEVEAMSTQMSISFEFYAVAARQESVREFLRAYFHQYTDLIEALIQQGIDRGEFRQTPTREAALTLVALFEGLNLLHVVDPEAIHFQLQAEAAVRLIINGLVE